MGRRQDPASINLLVVHCAATPNGRWFTASDIDRWHAERGYHRDISIAPRQQRQLRHIGYHYVINLLGAVECGRPERETGAHVRGYNQRSLGICLIGTDRFTPRQWAALEQLVAGICRRHAIERAVGHRDLSPDRDGDGRIEPDEWLKRCPGFEVGSWLDRVKRGLGPEPAHVIPDLETRPRPPVSQEPHA